MVDFMEGGQGMGAKGFQCLEMRDIDWVMGKNCSELTACDGRKSSFEGGVEGGVGGFFATFLVLGVRDRHKHHTSIPCRCVAVRAGESGLL